MSHGVAFADIAAVLDTYFDGLHHSDTARLRRVFHPEARYHCATDGTLLTLDMPEYFRRVDARPSPASQGHARTDQVLAIDLAGPVTAFAKVVCSIPPRHFIDFLTLVHLDGRWQIVAKVFHFTVQPAQTDPHGWESSVRGDHPLRPRGALHEAGGTGSAGT